MDANTQLLPCIWNDAKFSAVLSTILSYVINIRTNEVYLSDLNAASTIVSSQNTFENHLNLGLSEVLKLVSYQFFNLFQK